MNHNKDISRNEGCAIIILMLFFLILIPAMATTGTKFESIAVAAAPTATALPPTVEPTVVPPTEVPAESGASASSYDAALVAQGQQQFILCSACHGADGRGLPNLGKDLVTSEFVRSQNDTDLLNFIKTGRPIWDPNNTTGIDMPAKGGNPMLTDDQLLSIIAYIRSLDTQ